MSFKPAPGTPSPSTPKTTIDASTPKVSDLFASLTAEASKPAAPKVEKPTPNASAPEEEAAEEASNSATEADQPEASQEVPEDGAENPQGEEAALPENAFEVTHRGKKVQFVLDKNDKKLQQTLAYGLEAPKLAEEKKALKRELAAANEKLKANEGLGKYSEARELAEAGYMESAVKEFLGEDLFKKFYNEAVIARLDYENATPEERIAIERKRFEAEKAEYNWKLNRGKDKNAEAEAKMKEAEVKARETELEGYGKAAIAKLNFAKLDASKEAQEVYKVKVWRAAMDDLAEWVESKGGKVTPTQAHIEKAIERNYNLLTGAFGRGKKVGNAKPASSASGNKAAAKASQNYDKTDAKGFEGLGPLAIFNKMRGS